MALVIKSVSKTVTDTAASLFPTGVKPVATGTVIFRAPSTNTQDVYVGDSNVNASTQLGKKLAAGDEWTLDVSDAQYIVLEKIYADAVSGSQSLVVIYFEPV